MKANLTSLALAVALALPVGAVAASGHDHAAVGNAASDACCKAPTASSYEATGVVKRVDAAQGKVTLKHDPVPSLGWPSMTMAFRVADAKTLASLKPESKIAFTFTQKGSEYVITAVQ